VGTGFAIRIRANARILPPFKEGFGPENLDFEQIEARLRGKCRPVWPAPDIPYLRF